MEKESAQDDTQQTQFRLICILSYLSQWNGTLKTT